MAKRGKAKRKKTTTRKKVAISKQNIRRILAKYINITKRLKREGFEDSKERQAELTKRVNAIYVQLQDIKASDLENIDVKDYRSGVKNVLKWYRQLFPLITKKSLKALPPPPFITDDYFELHNRYWEMPYDITEPISVSPPYLHFYSENLYKGSIQGTYTDDTPHALPELEEYLEGFVRFLNEVQQAVRGLNETYSTEDINWTMRWRRSENGKYYESDKPFWNKKLQCYEIEIMLTDRNGNKLTFPDFELAKFNLDGKLDQYGKILHKPEKTVEDVAVQVVNGDNDFKKRAKEEVKKADKKETKKEAPQQENEKVELAKIEANKSVELKRIEATKEIIKQELEDLRILFEKDKISFKEYKQEKADILKKLG